MTNERTILDIMRLSLLSDRLEAISSTRITGRVRSIVGMTLTAVGLENAAGIGSRCMVRGRSGDTMAEVVGIHASGLQLLPFGTWDGVAAGDEVDLLADSGGICPDESWLGLVIDALGNPLTQSFPHPKQRHHPSHRTAPLQPFERRRVGEKLETQISIMDVFVPLCRGQRMGVFAGSGVGKSTLMAMLARHASADVIVIGLVGERGREVREFIQDDLGEEGMARSVVVVATGDQSALMRRQAAWTATTVAEHFCAQGKHVLLLLDSLTRFAMAQREIGLSCGEPPTTRGYPPTVFSELPQLLERAGPGRDGEGDITAIYTVLVDGDDMNEPISDAIRGIVDGHLVLDRKIAEQGRFPAINVQRSISRMLPKCHSREEQQVMSAARNALARYADIEDLYRVGAYQAGTSPETDGAIRFFQMASAFLSQAKDDVVSADQSFAETYRMLLEAGLPDPLVDMSRQATETV